MLISAIAAMNKSGVIGVDGDIPWKSRLDMKHFRSMTMGKPVIMGRKTFDSLSAPLPGRLNIIVSRSMNSAPPKAMVCSDLIQAIEQAWATTGREIMIIGGGEIYASALPICHKLYLTIVDHEVESGNTVMFPHMDPLYGADSPANWDVTHQQTYLRTATEPTLTFRTLVRTGMERHVETMDGLYRSLIDSANHFGSTAPAVRMASDQNWKCGETC